MLLSKSRVALFATIAAVGSIPFRMVADDVISRRLPEREALVLIPVIIGIAIAMMLMSRTLPRSDKLFFGSLLAGLAALCASYALNIILATLVGIIGLCLAAIALIYARRQSQEWNNQIPKAQ